eukprot:TRINITY_DN4786_c0_g1_i1.p1 TRINITY_DN4786_c0_g1~~TRINITY_DN4786_c0_g1_i1.p1  ORF type:complete len:168 (+),score=22.16 TRINITY_DN4786_c0_g1_i1:31-504(+)
MASCSTVCIVFLLSGFSTCSADCGNFSFSCTAIPASDPLTSTNVGSLEFRLNSSSFVKCQWPLHQNVNLTFEGSDTPYYTADGVECKKHKINCKDEYVTTSFEIAFDDKTGLDVIAHLCNLTDRPTTTTTTSRPNAALGNIRGSVFMILSALMFVAT